MFENQDNYFANYIEEDSPGKAQFLWTGLFYFMMKTAIDCYGEKGEGIMRQAVRDLGRERAYRKRQRADAMGLDPSLVAMNQVLDLYGDPRFDFGKQISQTTPEEKIIKVYTCPNNNIWARLEGKKSGERLEIGSIYCEEVHHYLYGKFDPAIQVNLCEILTKGDEVCNFRLNMRKANMKPFSLPPYKAESWEDYGTDVTGSIYTVFCLNYFHYAGAAYRELGEKMLCKALHDFAKVRAQRIRELNKRKGHALDIAGLLQEGDLFLDDREGVETERGEDGEFIFTYKRSIMHEVLSTHHMEELIPIYYEQVVAKIISEYNPVYSCRFENLDGNGENLKLIVEKNEG